MKKFEKPIRAKFVAEQKFEVQAIMTELKSCRGALVKKSCCDSLENLTDSQIFQLQKNLTPKVTDMFNTHLQQM